MIGKRKKGCWAAEVILNLCLKEISFNPPQNRKADKNKSQRIMCVIRKIGPWCESQITAQKAAYEANVLPRHPQIC